MASNQEGLWQLTVELGLGAAFVVSKSSCSNPLVLLYD